MYQLQTISDIKISQCYLLVDLLNPRFIPNQPLKSAPDLMQGAIYHIPRYKRDNASDVRIIVLIISDLTCTLLNWPAQELNL